LGVTASSTKWLSQWGQYSSDSSKVSPSLRKAFLHFLQAKTWFESELWKREGIVGAKGQRRRSQKKGMGRYHFSSLRKRMVFGLVVAVCAVEPLPTCSISEPEFAQKEGKCVQQGDLIETCALRICLLGSRLVCNN
jgi:hypothetical protein